MADETPKKQCSGRTSEETAVRSEQTSNDSNEKIDDPNAMEKATAKPSAPDVAAPPAPALPTGLKLAIIICSTCLAVFLQALVRSPLASSLPRLR